MSIIEHYPQISGSNSRLTCIANQLASTTVLAPHNGRPFSEAMLLGISGGLGCTYILWEFKKYSTASLVTGFTYRCNYFKEAVTQAIERAGAKVTFRETSGSKTAIKHLDQALDEGKIPSGLLDPYYMPHRGIPDHLEGCGGIDVTICGREGNGYLVQDRGIFPLNSKDMSSARGRVGSYKNRLVLLEPAGAIDIEKSIRAGIADCVRYLGEPSTSFGIPAIAKWARLITDSENQKGWRKVFAEGRGLFNTLVSIYTSIEQDGSGGLRNLYAEFLGEADAIVSGLEDARAAYKTSASAWTRVAHTAIASFPEMRKLCDERLQLLAKSDSSGLKEVNAEIENQRKTHDGNTFEPDGLFDELQSNLKAVVAAEKSAHATLKASEKQIEASRGFTG